MIVQRIRGIRSLLTLAQMGLATVLFWVGFAFLAGVVSRGSASFVGEYSIYWLLILAGLGVEVVTRDQDKLTAPIYDSSLVRKLPITFRQTCFAFGGLLLFLALAKRHAISRAFLVGLGVSLYSALLWSNAALPMLLASRFFRKSRDLATLLVGPSHRVGALHQWLERKRLFGLRIVGLVATDAPPYASVDGGLLLGNLEQLDQVLDATEFSQVISLDLAHAELSQLLLRKCEQRGLRLLIVNNFAEQIRHPIVCCVDEGVNLITLHEEPLENPFNRLLKRILDLVIACAVIVLVMPWLTALVWIMHRLESKGPLWYRQKRSGLQNRPFEIIKFRTMHVAADETRQATANDARVFPAGRWLRRFSLDEIPQFLNVFRGDMSVVGPRPHLIEHNRQFAEVLANYHFRSFIKPGITGLAQVRGFRGEARETVDISARLQSDLVYLENWSLSLDLGIVLRTMWQMIRPPRTAV